MTIPKLNLTDLNKALAPHSPTFDRNGYPTDDTLQTITNWPMNNPREFIQFAASAWSFYGRIWVEGTNVHMATGGWSGNEHIIYAMQQNPILWGMIWRSSTRGGKYVFELPQAIIMDKSTTNE